MRYLKQSTSVDVPIGPFLDDTDGKTAKTGLTITQPDVRLKKNNGNWAQKAAAQTLAHEENGWYEVTLDATDTDTLGALVVAVAEGGALPVWMDFMVLPANVYDALVAGSDFLQVGLREIESTVTIPAGAVPGMGLVAGGTLSGTHSTTTADLGTNAPSFDIGGATLLIAGRPPRTVDSYNTGTGVATFSPAMASAPVDALAWALLASSPASEVAPTLTSINAKIDVIDDFLDTEVAAIKAKTDNLPSDPADASDIAALLAAISAYIDTEVAAIKAKTDNLPSDPADASDIAASFASITSTLSTISGYLDTEIAAIKAKTDNLPSDPADASDLAAQLSAIAAYIDTEVAAIKAKTDNLPSDPADESNIQAAIANLLTYVDTEVAAIKAKTDLIPAAPAAVGDIPTAATIAAAVHTTALTESYSTDGGQVTMSQALYELLGLVSEFAVVGTTMTVKKRDGSTTAFTVTLNDATNPTAITRGT